MNRHIQYFPRSFSPELSFMGGVPVCPPPCRNSYRPDSAGSFWLRSLSLMVAGCGACGRRSACRGQRVSVVHGKQAGARSASSTNPQPLCGHRLFNLGALQEGSPGSIRTRLQGPYGGQTAAAGERIAGADLARGRRQHPHPGALAKRCAGGGLLPVVPLARAARLAEQQLGKCSVSGL
jgi:hypothetical protein